MYKSTSKIAVKIGVALTLYPDMAGEGGCSCFGRIDFVFLVRVVALEGR